MYIYILGTGTSSTVRTTTSTTTTSTRTCKDLLLRKFYLSNIDLFLATTTTTTASVTTTLPPVQVVDPSSLIKQCEQPVIIGTLASTVIVGVITTVIFGIFFSKVATSIFKTPSHPTLRN